MRLSVEGGLPPSTTLQIHERMARYLVPLKEILDEKGWREGKLFAEALRVYCGSSAWRRVHGAVTRRAHAAVSTAARRKGAPGAPGGVVRRSAAGLAQL